VLFTFFQVALQKKVSGRVMGVFLTRVFDQK
jgi:hypothetical protein